jgi:hypothetical protein
METTPARHRELWSSLEGRLEQYLPRATSPVSARIRWLSEQLENYVERWLGFAALPQATMPGLLKGDLFAAVEIGAAVLDEEIRLLPGHAETQVRWTDFQRALASLRHPDARPTPDELRATLRAYLATVPVS